MWQAIAGGIATLGAAHLANKGAKRRNVQAEIASAKQMQFQRDMSNTAYQRGMKDMAKAGLNPILAGKVGGASTPTGSTYNPENVATSTINAMQASNAMNLTRQQARNQQLDADLKQLDYNALKKAGLSPMMMRHTVLNQAGSEMFSNAKNLYSSVKRELLPKVIQDDFAKKFVTGRALTDAMKGTKIDKTIRNFINAIKKRARGQ